MTDILDIAGRIKEFHSIVPEGVEIVAVSKFHPAQMIMQAYEAGQRIFGESRVQEFLEKEKTLPKDIRWHFIGHLQTNKVKSIIGKTSLIESVDSLRLSELINRESEKAGIITEILLQVHVAAEEEKFGFFPKEIFDFINSLEFLSFKNLKVRGIMGMATNTDDNQRILNDFEKIHAIFEELKSNPNLNQEEFNLLSMGMSGDWPLAVEKGANVIRIGSAIFGSRY
ncbi:MAG: YggS family pyridoxal phosphate-dependent enzyme [Muribaculaceae bacterium]|nr:YggS family pyridoxal phosphate-dependent enzyme [Muribaculaceae bacterium]